MPGLDDWLTAATTATDDDLRERILTGFKDGKPFTPYRPTRPWPPTSRVLDFGCGLGRNLPFLSSVAPQVTGFDLPPMIARCRGVVPPSVATLSDDWPALRADRFDVVFASLVLQHIETSAVQAYLRDFAAMAPLVYLLTRTDTDFGAGMFDLIVGSGLYRAAGDCVEVDHDPATHQLRVLSTQPFEEARLAPAGRHFEVWLEPVSRDR